MYLKNYMLKQIEIHEGVEVGSFTYCQQFFHVK